MENELNILLDSIMTQERIKYLPLMWNEAEFHDEEVDLHFSVFDPCHLFDPNLSLLKVNGQNYSFNHQINSQSVDLTFTLKRSEVNSPFAQIDFSFYPHQKTCEDSWRQSWFVPLFVEKLNLPESKRLFRVIGDTRTSSYLVGGADIANKISLLIEKKLGLSVNQIDILDWGCGCGRISQFLPHLGVSNLVGADIDQDNAQWCSENIKEATFKALPYYPPTDFADESFDVVFGVSVMTHLTEETHKLWLQEVKRILKPGGYALLSVRGFVYYHLSKSWGIDVNSIVARIEREGFVDLQQDPALAEVITEHEYYRAAFCSHDYIRRVWSQYFHVIDILEGLVLQDMIVLQKPR